ncbi:hypothetical protein B0O80DRAFT_427301 [Mortierella sp. GBAus27b]|nr:hypothetical protein B0O80DRAFT_427301 [Mortierella sp. GBAus27b]
MTLSPTLTSSYPDMSASLSSLLSSLHYDLSDPTLSSSSQTSPALHSQDDEPPSQVGMSDPQGCEDMDISPDNQLHVPLSTQEQSRDHTTEPLDDSSPMQVSSQPNLHQDHGDQGRSFSLVAWEADQLRELLGISEHDIQGPFSEQDHGTTLLAIPGFDGDAAGSKRPLSASLFPTAEIKRPDVKEAFIHPGFYSLSDQSSTLSMPRKRSLPEGSQLCAFGGSKRALERPGLQHHHSTPELGRYSLDNQMQQTKLTMTPPQTWAYSTLSRSPTAPPFLWQTWTSEQLSARPSQQPSDIPPSQPYMAAFPSILGSHHHEHQPLAFLHNASLNRYQHFPVTSRTLPSPSQRKRRAKYKSDLFPGVTLYDSTPRGSPFCPLNAVPPPLQQRHQPYSYPASLFGRDPSRQESRRQQQQQQPPQPQPPYHHSSVSELKSSTYRRNPGEVPASTLPPDHFVFQEALLRRRSESAIGTDVATGTAGSATTTHQVPYPSLSILASAVATSGSIQPKVLTTQEKLSSSTSSCTFTQSMKSGSVSAQVVQDDLEATAVADETGENEGCSPNEDSDSAQVDDDDHTITAVVVSSPSKRTQRALSPAAIFAQSLSTITTLDPAATKLIDQLRLQEYLRTVQSPSASPSPMSPSSTPSPPSSIATSIIASSTLF